MIAQAVRLLTGNGWITDTHKQHEFFMQGEVERGAKLLDEFFEGGSWREHIDFEKLDMGSMGQCVLGQLFGNYRTGVVVLGLRTLDDCVFHGFMSHPYPTLGHSFVALKATWIVLLEKGGVPECQPASLTS